MAQNLQIREEGKLGAVPRSGMATLIALGLKFFN